MAKPKKSRASKTQVAETISVADQFGEIMGHFMEAKALVVVTQRSLESIEDMHSGDEADALRVAVEMLRRVYNELDTLAARCHRAM